MKANQNTLNDSGEGLSRSPNNDSETREVCQTCCRTAGNPFRVYDAYGKVTEGCVDRFHDGRLITTSESNRWHNRREAKAIRIARREWLRNLRLAPKHACI